MGAKDSVKFKLRRATFKCDICPMKFLSSQALASHTPVHKGKAKSKIQARELNTLLGKSIKPLEKKKSVKESDLVLEVEPTRIMDFRKVEYECPQCHLCFAVYFSAFRHIQKNHCVNSKGIKVPANSSEIIKPIRIEACMKCNQRLLSNDPHSCEDICTSIDPMATYICTGCKQQFNSLNLFDMHVIGLHSDDVETLFFPDRVEFSLWKVDLESQTKVRYLLLDGKNSTKQVYHCTNLSTGDDSEDNVINFCPSTIFVKDFTKSIQVHIYKQHFGHDCKYKLPAKFIKYRIKQLLQTPLPITEPFELKSLQMDFKTLLDYLLVESKKCDKATLDVLHKKAQEMLAVVNNCSDAPKTNKRNMTDDQISDTLESMDVKRKKTHSPVKDIKPQLEPERAESDVTKVNSSVVTSNTEFRSKRKVKIKEEEASTPAKFVLSSPCSSKSSFNDSYREFVDKNFKAQTEVVEEKKKPGKTYSKSNGNQSNLGSPDHKTVSKPNSVKNKKKIVKTKIGQFKPSLSPKVADNDIGVPIKDRRSSIGKIEKDRSSIGKIEKDRNSTGKIEKDRSSTGKIEKDRSSTGKIEKDRSSTGKIDFEYEVREQENDCNILILKI